MRAIVANTLNLAPEVTDFTEPTEEQGRARVVAAPLNPVDRVIATGKMGFRPLVAPAVLGLEGVAERGDGKLQYFFAPALPYGSYAEYAPLNGAEVVPVPAGLDAVHAAALGVPGVAAYLALTRSGHLQPGQSVLVLGAGGSVGRLALQAARELGAGVVAGAVGAADGLETVERFGARPVALGSDHLDADLSAAAPDGFDVIIDLLWGDPLAAALPHLAPGARIVQVGNSAGAASTLNAPAFRNKGAVMLGHSNFLATPTARTDAYAHLAALAAKGRIEVAADPITLDEFGAAWRGEGPAKPILTC